MRHSNSATLPKATALRKQRFLAALRLAGVTMKTWAEKNGTTQGYVSNLIAGRRENAVLAAKVDQLIQKYLPDALRRAS